MYSWQLEAYTRTPDMKKAQVLHQNPKPIDIELLKTFILKMFDFIFAAEKCTQPP
jgi:hypothetical protein